MPSEQEREFELVLGNRQLFSVLFIVIVLLAVFFSMGYVMGRNSAPAVAARSAEPASRETVSPRPSASSTQPAAPAGDTTSTPSQSLPLPTPAASTPAQSPQSKPLEVAPVSVTEPQPGQTYWQVSAVAKPEAELLVEVLTNKKFRAIVAPGPNEKLFRVLVGPARDQAELGKLRSDLEQAGFKPMLRKY